MGRHSAPGGRGRRNDAANGTPRTPGGDPSPTRGTPDAPTGRRRRPGTPAPGAADPHTATAPRAPGPRPAPGSTGPGQHPEHPEHAAWGAPDGWLPRQRAGEAPDAPADGRSPSWALAPDAPGPRPRPTPHRPPRPRGPREDGPTGPLTGAVRRGPGAGPRQDFLDAFDRDDRDDRDDRGDRDPAGRADTAHRHPAPAPRPKRRRWAFLAVTAALAVLAVLAGAVTGRLPLRLPRRHAHTTAAHPAASRAAAPASRSADRSGAPSPSPSPSAKPTYAQAMAAVYPLAPHLKLGGHFRTVPGTQKAPGHGRLYRVRVEYETGLPLDPKLFAEAVFKTLNNAQSWGHGGTKTFERVSSGHADIVITLASPGTTGVWCAKSGLDTVGENVSCDSAATPRTMINAYRWAEGSPTYGKKKIFLYREMVIDHEVGHRLGHNHVACPANGALAPVMMQQTKFLTQNGHTCKPNPWPYPKGHWTD